MRFSEPSVVVEFRFGDLGIGHDFQLLAVDLLADYVAQDVLLKELVELVSDPLVAPHPHRQIVAHQLHGFFFQSTVHCVESTFESGQHVLDLAGHTCHALVELFFLSEGNERFFTPLFRLCYIESVGFRSQRAVERQHDLLGVFVVLKALFLCFFTLLKNWQNRIRDLGQFSITRELLLKVTFRLLKVLVRNIGGQFSEDLVFVIVGLLLLRGQERLANTLGLVQCLELS